MKNKRSKNASSGSNRNAQPKTVSKPVVFGLSRVGKKVIFSGVGLAIAGYYVLTLADPMGQNMAATISPFLILGGYALVGLGLLVRDPLPSMLPPSSPSPHSPN